MKLKKLFGLSSRDGTANRRLDNRYRDFHRLYSLGGVIGKGGFGTVHGGHRKSDGLPVAVKMVNKARVASEDGQLQGGVPLEVALMQQVAGVPGIVKLIDFFDMDDSFYIVMERAGGSKDLFDYITEHGPMPESLARDLFRQVVDIVTRCHQRGVIHRDIKDENILIDMTSHQLTLIDFGSGSYLHSGTYTEYEGTRVYAPPEWIKFRSYHGEALTVWSLGILLYDMICGDIPFETDTQIKKAELYWKRGITVSQAATDLVGSCLAVDEAERIRLGDLLAHPWFASGTRSLPATRADGGGMSTSPESVASQSISMMSVSL